MYDEQCMMNIKSYSWSLGNIAGSSAHLQNVSGRSRRDDACEYARRVAQPQKYARVFGPDVLHIPALCQVHPGASKNAPGAKQRCRSRVSADAH